MITDKIKLPSRSLFYENIPAELTIRSMGTEEEKLVYSSISDETINTLISACIVGTTIDVRDLTPIDKHFILMKLRILTYGGEYHIEARCPYCKKKHSYTINLEDLISIDLAEDFEYPLAIDLPISKDKLKLKVLSGADHEAIEKDSKRIYKQFPNYQGDASYHATLMKHILSVEGKEFSVNSERLEYVKLLEGRDSAQIWNAVDSVKYGYDLIVELTCKNPLCREEFESGVPSNQEFFRPKYDNSSRTV